MRPVEKDTTKASLAPIIGALLLLIVVSLFGLAISVWPAEPAAPVPEPRTETERGISRAYDGSLVEPPPPGTRRSRWI